MLVKYQVVQVFQVIYLKLGVIALCNRLLELFFACSISERLLRLQM